MSGNIDSFFKEIQAIFACLPYEINKSKEGYFHSHLHLLLRMIGAKITSEVSTNTGRIDSVIELTRTIYILEFKIGNSQKALSQILDKQYAQSYQNEGKKIIIIGIACSAKERNILNWKIVQHN